jgi:GT2 family glycosyltransferase
VKIAVALSFYNGVKLEHLKESLHSIYAQSLKGDIFLKIDGEVDEEKYLFLMNEYREGRVFYLSYRENSLGIASSFNELFEEILKRGYRYIFRMDSDDIMVKERIELQVKFLEEHRDIDLVGGFIEEFGDGFEYHKVVKYPTEHRKMFKFFSKRVPIANVTTTFRDSFFKKAGLYPTSSPTNEDTLLWIEGFKSGCKFANLPYVLVKVRISRAFFGRRGGFKKAWSDFLDRVKVIRELKYGYGAYLYAVALFIVNISPAQLKKILYKRLR